MIPIKDFSQHAIRRAQQRAIPVSLVQRLNDDGRKFHIGGGVVLVIPSPKLQKTLPDSLRNVAAILGADSQTVITVMHRHTRIMRDTNTLRAHRGGRRANSL